MSKLELWAGIAIYVLVLLGLLMLVYRHPLLRWLMLKCKHCYRHLPSRKAKFCPSCGKER